MIGGEQSSIVFTNFWLVQGPVNSGHGRRLVKDINQEVFGLKTVQGHGSLKKVERKRLADLVLQLRQAS